MKICVFLWVFLRFSCLLLKKDIDKNIRQFFWYKVSLILTNTNIIFQALILNFEGVRKFVFENPSCKLVYVPNEKSLSSNLRFFGNKFLCGFFFRKFPTILRKSESLKEFLRKTGKTFIQFPTFKTFNPKPPGKRSIIQLKNFHFRKERKISSKKKKILKKILSLEEKKKF